MTSVVRTWHKKSQFAQKLATRRRFGLIQSDCRYWVMLRRFRGVTVALFLSPVHTSDNVKATFDFTCLHHIISVDTRLDDDGKGMEERVACWFDIVASVNRALRGHEWPRTVRAHEYDSRYNSSFATFRVKAATLKQQISHFYLQILSKKASFYICGKLPDGFVRYVTCDFILVFQYQFRCMMATNYSNL